MISAISIASCISQISGCAESDDDSIPHIFVDVPRDKHPDVHTLEQNPRLVLDVLDGDI